MTVGEGNPSADGEAILTDADVSYVHVANVVKLGNYVAPSNSPESAKAIFTFENIVNIKKVDNAWGINGIYGVFFEFKNNDRIRLWDGASVDGIVFTDPMIRDEFLNKLTEAKAAWNKKYSELL